MREIVLDTETTGLEVNNGDRIVEIGCVELENHIPTGRTFQEYLNPEMEMSEKVIEIHGITNEFVKDKPTFKEIAEKFINFIGDDSKLVIHNASFDMKFLNAELKVCHLPPLSDDRVIDTLLMARQKFPGSRVRLDDLCKRFNIDASARTVHGALLDSQLLAEVYLELIGREPDLILASTKKETQIQTHNTEKVFHQPRSFPATDEELENHKTFVKKIPDNFWNYPEEKK